MIGWLTSHAGEVTRLFGWHAWLSVLPLVIGLAISIPLGWLARRFPRAYPPMVGITGLLYTIPSLALFVVLPAILGTRILDPVNVVVALTVYTVALLVRTVADGLGSVPEDVLQAATAMGYRRIRRLLQVELPVAVPVIAAGLRVAAEGEVQVTADKLGYVFQDPTLLPWRTVQANVELLTELAAGSFVWISGQDWYLQRRTG